MPPEVPRPPRRPSHVDPGEVDDPFEHPSRIPPLRDSSASFEPEPGSRSGRDPGRYALLRPEVEDRLVRALKTLESIPPLQTVTSAKVDSVNVELMKLAHQAQLEGQRRDLAFERLGERVATVEHRVGELEKLKTSEATTELDRARQSQSHWIRYVITVVVSLATGAVLLGLGRLLR